MFIIVGLCVTIMIDDSVLVVPVYLKGKFMGKSRKILPTSFGMLPVRQIKRLELASNVWTLFKCR